MSVVTDFADGVAAGSACACACACTAPHVKTWPKSFGDDFWLVLVLSKPSHFKERYEHEIIIQVR